MGNDVANEEDVLMSMTKDDDNHDDDDNDDDDDDHDDDDNEHDDVDDYEYNDRNQCCISSVETRSSKPLRATSALTFSILSKRV